MMAEMHSAWGNQAWILVPAIFWPKSQWFLHISTLIQWKNSRFPSVKQGQLVPYHWGWFLCCAMLVQRRSTPQGCRASVKASPLCVHSTGTSAWRSSSHTVPPVPPVALSRQHKAQIYLFIYIQLSLLGTLGSTLWIRCYKRNFELPYKILWMQWNKTYTWKFHGFLQLDLKE